MTRALFIFGLLFAGHALACAVCGQGNGTDQNQDAYKFMTIIMSLTPLALIGGVVSWVFWRVRKHDAGEEPAPAPAPASDVEQQNASA